MNRPSEKALSIAEDLLDYVHPGMSRVAAAQEIATFIDEMNADLIGTVNALLEEAERSGPGPHAVLLAHLREVVADYRPWQRDSDGQHELFTSPTETTTGNVVVAGQMP
jgi:hypothetical protein